MPPADPEAGPDGAGLLWTVERVGPTQRWQAFNPHWRWSDGSPAGSAPVLVVDVLDGRVVHLSTRYTPVTARLWWVEVPETSAEPPATALMAFDTPAVAPGSVVDPVTFRGLGVTNDQQAGAVRWWPSTGQVHQMYVAPARRRQRIGTALVAGAWGYARLRGWPPVWGDGRRTDLGQVFLTRATPGVASRVQRRTHVLPPMTPPEAAAGLDRRLVEPDD